MRCLWWSMKYIARRKVRPLSKERRSDKEVNSRKTSYLKVCIGERRYEVGAKLTVVFPHRRAEQYRRFINLTSPWWKKKTCNKLRAPIETHSGTFFMTFSGKEELIEHSGNWNALTQKFTNEWALAIFSYGLWSLWGPGLYSLFADSQLSRSYLRASNFSPISSAKMSY